MRVEIIIYGLALLATYIVLQYYYKQYQKRYSETELSINEIEYSCTKKLGVVGIILISLIWVLYNKYLTGIHPILGDDWVNYAANFSMQRTSPSIGLEILMRLFRKTGGDMYALSRFSTFTCILICMIAYRNSKYATPRAIVMLFLTQYAYLTMSLLKQTFCNAFATLFFIIMIQQHSRMQNLLCIVLIFLSCLFHPSGFIMIPMFFILNNKLNRRNLFIYIWGMIIFGIFFRPIMTLLGGMIAPIIPVLGNKISQYFNIRNLSANEGSLAFLKAIPELIIVLLAIYKRKSLHNRIENYDNYLLVSVTGVFFYLMSFYSVWIYRMVYLFHFSIFVLADIVLENMIIKSNKSIISKFLIVLLGIIMYRFLYLTMIQLK